MDELKTKPCLACGTDKPPEDYKGEDHCCRDCHSAVTSDFTRRYQAARRARDQTPEAIAKRRAYENRPDVLERRRKRQREAYRRKVLGPDEY